MDTTTTTSSDESTAPNRRVRKDALGGGCILAFVIGGNLLWHASDAGVLAALGQH